MADQATQVSAAPVIVINARKGISVYALAVKGKLDDGSEGTKHDPIRFMPGANRVPADRWKMFLKECKQDLDNGTLRVMDKALKSYEERDALALVKNTIDKALLKAFRASDQRPAVRKAIDKQIADITGKAVEEDDEELTN
jgi:hypothetical protein